MQKFILFFFLLSFSTQLSAGILPEPVFPLTQSIHPLDYYVEQFSNWEKHLDEYPTDAKAWLYYYTSARNINVLNATQTYDLESIVQNCSKNIPDTFENHFIQYWQGGLLGRKHDELLKAHELAPDRWEAYHDLMHYYKIIGKQDKFSHYAQRLFQSGHLSSGILDWNYNALMSVSKNGILVTQGDNDTYPAWVLQEVKHIRRDVNVVNLFLLLAEDAYRNRVFAQLNITTSFDKNDQQPIDNQARNLINHLATYSSRPLFLGIATPSQLRKELSNQLYITGLAFEHSQQTKDNLTMIDNNFKNQFRTESLTNPIIYDRSQSVVDHMNMNYIPSFALLYKYYKESNRPNEAEQTKFLITEIATRASKLEEVEVVFSKKKEEKSTSNVNINFRTLDKNMKPIGTNLYASATEVNNEEYDVFLENLLKNREFDLLEKCQIHPTEWRSFLPENLKTLGDAVIYNNAHPDAGHNPIVNISYEAAQLYCDWLTKVYNQSGHRKKAFKKVRFRLPSNEEWTIAARGGRKNAPYPWGGSYYRNTKGCLLANFDPSQEIEVQKNIDDLNVSKKENDFEVKATDCPANDDGAFFTVNVDAYFPNDLGLYNMSGNIAEMVNQEGITRGGSWNDPSYFIQIEVQKEEMAPSPNVGFRVFMDVLK